MIVGGIYVVTFTVNYHHRPSLTAQAGQLRLCCVDDACVWCPLVGTKPVSESVPGFLALSIGIQYLAHCFLTTLGISGAGTLWSHTPS